MPFPTLTARRYVAPLREGGSLPALVEAERADGASATVVVKFRGAGQGARTLLAEWIVGGIAERLGLPVPELSVVDLPEGFGRAEPDAEIQDVLRASVGLNAGLAFLPGAFAYDPTSMADLVDVRLASEIVWLDALTVNVDRTARNPNLLVAPSAGGPALWLIDHGAALYVHHDWPSVTPERTRAPFAPIAEHVLLPRATDVREADARLAPTLTANVLDDLLAAVPDDTLMHAPPGRTPPFESPDEARQAYVTWFATRLAAPRAWAEAAAAAHEALASAPTDALPYRR